MEPLKNYLKGRLDSMRSKDKDFAFATGYENYGIFFALSCFYPNIKPEYLVYSLIQFTIYFITLFLSIVELLLSMYHSFIDSKLENFVQNFYVLLIVFLTFFMLIWSNLKREIQTDFYTLIYRKFTYDDVQGLHVLELEDESKKLRKYIYMLIKYYFLLAYFFILVIGPITDLYSRNPATEGSFVRPLPFKMYSPIDTNHVLNYVLIFFVQIYACTVTVIISGMASLGCLMLNQRILENITVMNYCIRNIRRRAINTFNKSFPDIVSRAHTYEDKVNLYSGELFEECFYRSLIQVAKHHHHIFKLVRCYQTFCTWPILYLFCNGPILISAALFAVLSNSDSVNYKATGLFIGCMILVIIGLICWYGEQIKSKGEGIVDNLYCMPWLGRNPKIHRAMLTILIAAGKEMKLLSSATNLRLNLDTFTGVMKASYSYVMFILTLHSNNHL